MKEYQVTIRELLEKTVTLEAKTALEARDIVEKGWQNGDYILDADHFKGVTFASKHRAEWER